MDDFYPDSLLPPRAFFPVTGSAFLIMKRNCSAKGDVIKVSKTLDWFQESRLHIMKPIGFRAELLNNLPR